MIYSHVIAIAVKIIPYSLILGFLLPYFSGMHLTYALVTAFILAVATAIADLNLMPVLLTPNLKHQTGLLAAAAIDAAIAYAVLYASQLIAAPGYAVPGFLLISILVGIAEIILHLTFNWALSPRLK